jgi:hypothetical protein
MHVFKNFQIETVLKSTIFWDITPCIPLKVSRGFGETPNTPSKVGAALYSITTGVRGSNAEGVILFCYCDNIKTTLFYEAAWRNGNAQEFCSGNFPLESVPVKGYSA